MNDLHSIHDASGLTAGELERAKRDLQVSLSMAWPGSPVREPILAEMNAIDRALAERTGNDPIQGSTHGEGRRLHGADAPVSAAVSGCRV
jgi:hypothetical protein